jgi:two-component system, LytTR family, sensor kinase
MSIFQNYSYQVNSGKVFHIIEVLTYLIPDYFFGWMLSIPAFYLFIYSRHWIWQKFVLFHLPISIFLGLCSISASMIVMAHLRMYMGMLKGEFWSTYWKIIKNTYAFGLSATINYWFFLIILLAWDFYRRYKVQTIAATELEARLTRSQLQALKMQLQPHFLFNAFNTISMLVRRQKNDQAVAMISGLSDLLRSTLTKPNEQLVALEEELDLLKKYLQIELVRFQDRLTVDWEISPETLQVLVPNLLLQPIVENAFKYGISQNIEGGKLKISSSLIDKNLIIRVLNSGSKLSDNWQLDKNAGIGLRNTQARLEQLYGQGYILEIKNISLPIEGVEVKISIPNLDCV